MRQELFKAEIPKIEDHLLPENYAKLASNCDFSSGIVKSFRALSKEEAIAITTCYSLFLHTENGNDHFITDASVRHYAKSPILDDSYERVYFTGESESRFYANDNISVGGFDPDVDYYKLGIPQPSAAPTVTSTGGGATYKGYVYSYVNSYGDEGPPSAVGSDDDFSSGTVAIDNISSAPSGRAIDRIYLYRTNSDASGIAEFQFVLEATWFDDATAYTVGEFVLYDDGGGIDLYKCTSPHSAGAWNGSHFTAGDDVTDANLLTVYPKTNYDPPPDDLTNLISLANGSFAGFVGNTVYFSEPFHPHAWPSEYRIALDMPIIGMSNEKNIITVMGTGRPYIIYGTHPSTMGRSRADEVFAGLDIRGICSGRSGVFFVTRNGIIFCNGESFVNITDALLSADNISDYTPSSLAIHWFDNKLFAFDRVGEKGFFIDFSDELWSFVSLSIFAHAAFVADDGYFYMVCDDVDEVDEEDPPASMPLAVKKWEGATTDYLLFTYQSREFVYQLPVNMSAAYVVLDQDFYDAVLELIDPETANAATWAAGITGSLGDDGTIGGKFAIASDELVSVESFSTSGSVTFKLYVDGTLIKSKTMNSIKNKFRLPGGYLGERMYYEISGYIPVKKVSIAPSMDEI